MQCRCKGNQDRKIRNVSKRIEVGKYFYLDQLSRTTSAAECRATEFCSKLLSVGTGPFPVIEVSVSLTKVRIDKDGISSTAPVGRATIAPAARNTPTENNRTKGNEANVEREEVPTADTCLEEEIVFNVLKDYSVNRIVNHLVKGDKVKLFGCLYCYTSAENTAEPPAHHPEHLIARSWRWMPNQDARPRRQREGNSGDKECRESTLQAGTLDAIYQRKTNKYPGYMEQLSMIREGGQ